MKYKLGIKPFGRVFTVPCAAENYLKLADPVFCKVLMAMLCADTDIADTDLLAEKCGVSPSQAEDAVIFWSSNGVVSAVPENGEPTAAVSAAAVGTAPAAPKAQPVVLTEAVDPMKNTAAARSTIRYTPKELAAKAKENTEIATLFEEVQKIFGRPINSTETAGFVNLYEYYGYSVATILMIASFAHEMGKDRIAYIEAVAKDWYSKGIVDYPDVEAEIIRQTEINKADEKLKRRLGIEGALTKKQLEYFEQWREWGFDIDTIDLAAQRCREHKNGFRISYTNGILKNWQNAGLLTVDAVISSEEKYAEEHKNDQNSSSSYDIDGWNDLALTFDPTMLRQED